MIVMLLSIAASLFPKRYRGRWFPDASLDVKRGAILSGVAEVLLPGFTLWLRYPPFIHALMAESAAQVAAHTAGDRLSVGISDFSVGMLGLWVYIFKPLNLLLIYLALEGGLRLMAAVATSEVVPSLPLQILGWLHLLGKAAGHEIALGERVPDVVIPMEGKFALCIQSCRPKEWTQLTTVRYQDSLFELAEEQQGEEPRRFVYFLRSAPQHKVVRGLHHYDPEEVLHK